MLRCAFLPTLPSLLILSAAAALASCGDRKETAWWEAKDACSDGATVEHRGTKVFCAKDGLEHGRYEELAEGGKVATLSGQYVDGKRDGVWTQRSEDGRVLGTYSLSAGTGTISVWRDDGSVDSVGGYEGGVAHGSWTRFGNKPGVKLEEGAHESGQPVGTWIFRDEAGTIVRRVHHKDGEVWKTHHFEDGELARIELSEAAQLEADKRAKETAQELTAARSKGILGVLAQQQGGAFASITGSGDFSSGLDKDVYGGLLGNDLSSLKGGGGLGLGGLGSMGGGGGTGGVGRIGGLKGGGGSVGSGRGGLGSSTPIIRMGRMTVDGGLDKAVVRRFLRRRVNQFRYCYDKELAKRPTLKGSVVLQLVISASGAVKSSKASGLDNNVHTCIARIARRIQFPKPKGGGLVSVRAPLVFAPRPPATPSKTTGDSSSSTDKKPTLQGGGAVKRRR